MDVLSVLFHQRSRSVGVIIPDVVVSEKHTDALEITEHPVEVGAAVSDHAYKKPSEVVMECGFSGGGSLVDFVDTNRVGLGIGLGPRETYQKIIELQESRIPFDVVTGKRIYSNMLLKAVEVTTDRTSENVLMATLTLREVIMTSTQSVHVADKKQMSRGVSTSDVQNTGNKVSKPADKNESMLSGIWGSIRGKS